MRKILLWIVLSIVVVLAGRLVFLLVPASGQFTSFETVGVDQCRKIEVAPGPEDIQIDHETGLAYISATDRRNDTESQRVGIYSLDLNNPDASPRRLEGKLPDGFAPHGISLWKSDAGERRLFVVNHPNGGHSVEIFKLDDNDYLTHLETITSDFFTAPNDVVAVGKRQFYVSNMQHAAGGIALTLELYLGLPVTDVIYFDGASATQALTGLIAANGLNVSADGSELYVAELIARRINIFKLAPKTGLLSDRRQLKIGTSPDNIDVAPDGLLYIGSHPNLLAFSKHAANANEMSASQIVRLDPDSGDYETVFMSIEGELNGSSVGAFFNDKLLVGGVFESHIMLCK